MIHKIRHRIRRHTISFKHAIDGIVWVFRTQPNYQVHVVLSVMAIALGLYFEIQMYEWLTILLLITVGLTIETINSTFEQTLDCVSLEKREDIRIAKDAAAGAMLIFAVGAAIAGMLIFMPKVMGN